MAVDALDALVRSHGRNQVTAIQASAIASLYVVLCRTSHKAAASLALRLLVDDNAKEVFVAADGVAATLALLHKGDAIDKAIAASMIGAVARNHGLARTAFTDAGVVQPLMDMLLHGGEKTAADAAWALGCLADCHPINKAALATPPIITRLVTLLHSGMGDEKLFATMLLGAVAVDVPATQSAIVEAGAIAPLLMLIQSGQDTDPQVAASTVRALIQNHPANQTAALEANAILALLVLLRDGSAAAQAAAANVVNCLVHGHPPAKQAFLDAQGVDLIVGILVDGVTTEQALAVRVLVAVCTGRTHAQNAFTAAGTVEALASTVQRGGIEDSQTRGAAFALGLLAENDSANKAAIVQGPVLTRLVQLLRLGTGDVMTWTATALGMVAKGDAAAQTSVRDANAIPLLIDLLRCGDANQCPAAADALGIVIQDHAHNQAVQANAIPALASLLRTGSVPGKRAAATTILCLVEGGNALCITAVDKADVVAALVAVLKDRDSDPLATQCKPQAAKTLGLLVTLNAEDCDVLAMEAGAVEALIELIQRSDVTVTMGYARTLATVVRADVAAQAARALAAGSIPVLVAGLESAEPRRTPPILLSLSCMVRAHPQAKVVVLATGVLAQLARLLQDEVASDHAANLLWAILEDYPAAANAGWETGIIASLAVVLRRGPDDARLQAYATLWSLVADDRSKFERLQQLIPLDAFLACLQTSVNDVKMMGVAFVLGAIDGNSNSRTVAIEQGLVDAVVDLIRPGDDYDPRCLLSLVYLVVNDPVAERAVQAGALELDDAIAWGVLDPLLELLELTDDDNRSSAAQAVAYLVRGHAANQDAVSAADFIPVLVAMLQSIPVTSDRTFAQEAAKDAQHNAAAALANLVESNPSLQRAAIDADAIPLLVEMIRTTDRETNKANADRVLCILRATDTRTGTR